VVERQLPKLNVAGSIPVSRSRFSYMLMSAAGHFLKVQLCLKCERFANVLKQKTFLAVNFS
jgi:hypothetical protein